MNKLQKFQKYVIYIFLLTLMIINAGLITNNLVRTNIESIESLSVSDCTHNTPSIKDYFNNNGQLTNLNIGYKEISIYPNISNLKCIGKLHNIPNLENYNEGDLYVQIYTSTNLINLINFLIIFVSISTLNIFRKFYLKYIIIALILGFFEILNTYYFYTGLHFYNYRYLISSILLFSILGGNFDYLRNKNEYFFQKLKKISFNSDLNTLRAFSVLSVVLYHFEIFNFTGGWLGVDVFFHISGFLISNRILYAIKQESFSFKTFYLQRIKRILPALYSTLIITSIMSYFVFSPKALIAYLESVISSIFIFSNYYFLNFDFYTAYSTKFLPLLHTWSLSIEEQFYLIFPLFIYILLKYKKPYFLQVSLGFLLFSLYINLETFSNAQKFYLLQFRIWQFIFGMFVMFLYLANFRLDKVIFKYFGYFLLIFSFVFYDNSALNSLFPKLLISIAFVLIILTKKNIEIFSFSFIKYLGLSSYSIYLVHQPVLAFFKYLNRQGFKNQSDIFPIMLIFSTIILGLINWKFVEKPFLKNKSPYLLIIAMLLSITTFSSIGIYTDGFSQREKLKEIPDEVLYYSINVNQYPLAKMKKDTMEYLCGYVKIPYFELNKNIVRYNCDSGPFTYVTNGVERNLYVIGDSHANMLSVSMIDQLNEDYNLTPLNGTIGRCILSGQADSDETLYACSEQFFNSFIDNLDSSKDVVVIIGRFDNWISDIGKNEFQSNKSLYLENLEFRFNKILQNVSSLIIVYPVPTFSYDIAEQYVSGNINWPETISIEQDRFKNQYQNSYTFLNRFNTTGVLRVYPEDIFCNSFIESECVASFKETLYYSDSNHLTLKGSELIAKNVYETLINK
jgi:peptidoglycan/LPS O-acetylase OafA/YrhL